METARLFSLAGFRDSLEILAKSKSHEAFAWQPTASPSGGFNHRRTNVPEGDTLVPTLNRPPLPVNYHNLLETQAVIARSAGSEILAL